VLSILSIEPLYTTKFKEFTIVSVHEPSVLNIVPEYDQAIIEVPLYASKFCVIIFCKFVSDIFELMIVGTASTYVIPPDSTLLI